MKVELVATIIILLFLIHPNIVNMMFSVFSCKDLDDGEKYLILSYDIKCWTTEHTFWATAVALPCLMIWGLGIPIVVMLGLVRNK
jgi:hypothetical protein